MKYRSILMFGAPGSGKGTQGKAIGCMPGFIHTSTGDLFRSLDRNSEMGRIFMEYSNKGQLVPDEFTVKLWVQTMKQWEQAGKFRPESDFLVMDGIPRNVNQAKLLADTIDVRRIILLHVSDIDKMVERLRLRALKENRMDDADEKVIRNRMAVYERETRPVLDYYPSELVARIDALMPPMAVLAEVSRTLAALKP